MIKVVVLIVSRFNRPHPYLIGYEVTRKSRIHKLGTKTHTHIPVKKSWLGSSVTAVEFKLIT